MGAVKPVVSMKLEPLKISFHLTATAEDVVAQDKKVAEEHEEVLEAQQDLANIPIDHPKRITLHLKVVQERIDRVKADLNFTRMYCDSNNLDFEKCLQLNDLNNDIRGYHG